MTLLMQLTDATTIPLLARVAAFAERRHEILAGNVAHLSTPGYRARDLPVAQFEQALARAVARHTASVPGQGRAWVFAGGPAADQPDLFPAELMRAAETGPASPSFQDGNNRSVERAVMEMSKNLMLQSLAIELMTAQFNRLQAVIAERP